MIPFDRIMQKLDEHFAQHDLAGAERLLDYWLQEALSQGDMAGEIQIRNEQLGLYRRLNDATKGLATAEALLPLLGDSVWEGTVLLNIATNYCHFGDPDKALPLYPRVEAAYRNLPADDERLAGYYNNRAATAYRQKQYDVAVGMYTKALQVQSLAAHPSADMGITYVNRAMCLYMQNPLDPAVDQDMTAAYDILAAYPERDGAYAYVLEKVLPIFAHLGYQSYYDLLKAQQDMCH